MYYRKLELNEQTNSPVLTKFTKIGCDNFVLMNDDGTELAFEPPPSILKLKKPTKKKAIKVTKTKKPKK